MATNTLNTITRVSAGEFLPKFKREFWDEWVFKNRFSRYMGDKEDMPIQFHYELKEGGQTIQFNFLRRIMGNGVGGNMLLEGRETTVGRDKCTVKVEYLREAIAVSKSDEKKSILEILPKVRNGVMNFSKDKQRDRVIDASFMSAPDVCMVAPLYNPDPTRVQAGDPAFQLITSIAGPAALGTWVTNNQDRVLFGNSLGNFSTTFATAMTAVGADTKGFTTTSISLMKDLAKNADPHITPLRIGDEDEPYYVIFCDTKSFRQLQNDPVMQAANQYARSREGSGWKSNPLRTGSDLEWDGCVIREVSEMKPIIKDAGITGAKADQVLTDGTGAWRGVLSSEAAGLSLSTGGIQNAYSDATAAFTPITIVPGTTKAYGRAVLMGANAVGLAVGQEPDFPDQRRDYGFRKGLALEEMYGVNKIQRQDLNTATKFIDNACVTAFFNATVA